MAGEEKKVRVLLADDHPAVRTSLHRLLDRTNEIEVVGEASDGEEALQMGQDLKPDVLLLDIEMPKVDGIEVTRILHSQGSPVQILIFSAYEDEEYIQNVMEQGASGYLIKDEAPAQIIQAILLAASGKKVARNDLYNQGYGFSYRGFNGSLG